MTDTDDTPEVALARQIHKRQALDRGHGPFTTRCICNLHAAEILVALDGCTLVPNDRLIAEAFTPRPSDAAEIERLRAAITERAGGPDLALHVQPCPCWAHRALAL